MKILKGIILTILTLLIIFLAIGLVKPEVHYGAEITVNKPIKEAWAVTEDETKYAQWLDGFKSEELISGQKGAVGSQYKIIVNPGDRQEDFEMIETLTDKKDYDYISMDFESEMMDFGQTMHFEEADGQTKIRTSSTVRGSNILMRSMFALMEMTTGSFQSQEEYNMNNLKKVIEENSKNYYAIDSVDATD